jgi:hypothetical protein
MTNMVAARSGAGFEFFAQLRQKSLGLAHTRQDKTKNHTPTKKPARRRAVKSKENLKYLKN